MSQDKSRELPSLKPQLELRLRLHGWPLSNFEYQLVALALQRSLRDGIMQALEEVELQKLGGLDFDLDFKVAVGEQDEI